MSIRHRDKEKAYARAAMVSWYLDAMRRLREEGFMGRPLVDFDADGRPLLNAIALIRGKEADRRVLVQVSPFAEELSPFCRIASSPYGAENVYFDGADEYYDDSHSPENGFSLFALAETVPEEDRLALFATMLLVFRDEDRSTFGSAHPASIGSIRLASTQTARNVFGVAIPRQPIETDVTGKEIDTAIDDISAMMATQWGYAEGRILSLNMEPFISLTVPRDGEAPIAIQFGIEPSPAGDVVATFAIDRFDDAKALGLLISEMSGRATDFGQAPIVHAGSVALRNHGSDICCIVDQLTDSWGHSSTIDAKAIVQSAREISGIFPHGSGRGYFEEPHGPWRHETRWNEQWETARENIGEVSRSRLAACETDEARRLLQLKVVADMLTYGKDTFVRD